MQSGTSPGPRGDCPWLELTAGWLGCWGGLPIQSSRQGWSKACEQKEQQERSKRTACTSENGKNDVDNESPVSLTARDMDTERVQRGRWCRNGERAVLCCRELTWQLSWAGHGKGFSPTELGWECHWETLR